MTKTARVRDLEWSWGFDDDNNHNDMKSWDHSPMKKDFHCYSFHGLYDHTQLDWKDILRIKEVYFDIELRIEY